MLIIWMPEEMSDNSINVIIYEDEKARTGSLWQRQRAVKIVVSIQWIMNFV